ncbi:DNA-binding transcriptional activator of the SARP family [Poseidonocella pacifica]|uniref:DNA-binding transcriptional activator of the SARP family n=1 Tax=Poseidonocella pacifica TaxID=871651 RepID=A0A1I0VPX1_9RHOB|nr:BTAD domain-containing putative transcriptional regulator [Poseidonocella pacifica]SFA78341.1 DNA-binding transcriptional activator of the SARP family [Poseidonocella pacifica]
MLRRFSQESFDVAPLEIRLFGELQLARSGVAPVAFPTRKARSILGFLALERHKPHFRDKLAEWFWPEAAPGQSRAALRTELWRIRLTLARFGVNPRHYLDAGQDTIRFRALAPLLMDVELFETAVDHPGHEADVLALYRADLLEGEYGDWCRYPRDSLRARFVDALERMMDTAMAGGDFRAAVALGMRLLGLDPLAEHVHRNLMTCHAARGNRPAALRQYAACASLLEHELNVEPMSETRALFDAIRGPGGSAHDDQRDGDVDAALQLARTALTEATRRLDRAIRDGCTP